MAEGRAIDVDVADLRILHASRRLIARWSYPGCRILFVVLHAPSDDDEESLQAFWEKRSLRHIDAGTQLYWRMLVVDWAT